MGTEINELPVAIQDHLKKLVKTAGLPDTDESYERMAHSWVEKENYFDEETTKQGLNKVDALEMDDSRGAVVLTYSGSLVIIGPLMDGSRSVGYSSIGIRKDVPETATNEKSKLAHGVKINEPIDFEEGPVQKTSPIYKIAVTNYELAPVQQKELVSDVNDILVTQFVEVNKTVIFQE